MGISANTITTTGNTTITADDVAYSAIYGYTEITFNEGAQVTVTDCTPKFYFSAGNYGDATAPIQMKVKHNEGDQAESYTEVPLTDKATLTVAEGATVTVSGSETGIYLPSNVTYTNNGHRERHGGSCGGSFRLPYRHGEGRKHRACVGECHERQFVYPSRCPHQVRLHLHRLVRWF